MYPLPRFFFGFYNRIIVEISYIDWKVRDFIVLVGFKVIRCNQHIRFLQLCGNHTLFHSTRNFRSIFL